MIDRRKENLIGVSNNEGIRTHFYFSSNAMKDDRRVAKPIINKKNMKVIALALIKQLYDELKESCRTELVKNVYVDIDNVYKTSDKKDINMDFFTDYLIRTEPVKGTHFKKYVGFTCGTTLGRYNIKDKKFDEISNSMLDKCDVM